MADYEDVNESIPNEFPFPYPNPYDIQLNFMKALYKTLELRRVGVFESPTGTGKSLSLICGSLKWLKDFKENQRKKLEKLKAEEEENKKNAQNSSNAFDWLTAHEQNFEKNIKNMEMKEFLDKQIKLEKSFNDLKIKAKQQFKHRKQRAEEIDRKTALQIKQSNKPDGDDPDDPKNENKEELFKDELDLILDDYKSDDDDDQVNFDDYNESDKEKEQVTKIFFCSRTHSQISQFIGELNKTVYAESTRVVTLGSRMNLCINDIVNKLNSIQAVNERCLELQKNKKNTTKSGSKKSKLDNKGCPYYKPNQYDDFNLKIMEEICDIEDVAKAGRETKICPYYGARYSIPSAEIVALPYNVLFQKEARESFSINLKNQIVIIDEAHNLIDAISQIHSIEITDLHVTQSLNQLNNYVNRYKSKFSAKNMLYLRQLLNVLNALNKIFTSKNDDAKFTTENGKLSLKLSKIWTISDFLTTTKLFSLNFIKLLRFCDETQLEKKLIGFHEKYSVKKENDENKPETTSANTPKKSIQLKTPRTPSSPAIIKKLNSEKKDANKEEENTPPLMKSPIMQIKQLLRVLSTPMYDGRILLNIDQTTRSTLKFILLNPNVCFEDIVTQAHSVILAGGTMKPISDFENLVGDKVKIEHFSCGHVIPKDNIACIGLAHGPNGVKFDFSYGSRDNVQILDELGKQIHSLSLVVPSGLVVFFVSYDYLEKCVNHFKKNNIMALLSQKKQVFYEPRLSSECDRVFNEYTKCIKKNAINDKQDGAILFAVVGGKMSEGINFSDDLGRCVVVVGQPYPNIKSLELQEKMQYLNKNQIKCGNEKEAGKIYYENLCWKAINQSIGRAIRHQNDYATILLIDARYCNTPLASLKEKLPHWIGDSLKQETTVFDNNAVMQEVKNFYERKSNKSK